MTSITINLTLEQVLEFVQNLPLEYKQAVKQKLESEKVEEIKQYELDYISKNSNKEFSSLPISNTIESINEDIEQPKQSKVDQIAGLVKDPNVSDYKTLRNEAIVARYKEKSERADKEQEERELEKKKEIDEIAERRAIVEGLAGKWKLPNDFDYKEEYRKLIIKKYN